MAGEHRIGDDIEPGHQHEGPLVCPGMRQGQLGILPAGQLDVDHVDVESAWSPPDLAGALRGGLTSLRSA